MSTATKEMLLRRPNASTWTLQHPLPIFHPPGLVLHYLHVALTEWHVYPPPSTAGIRGSSEEHTVIDHRNKSSQQSTLAIPVSTKFNIRKIHIQIPFTSKRFHTVRSRFDVREEKSSLSRIQKFQHSQQTSEKDSQRVFTEPIEMHFVCNEDFFWH